MISSMSGEEQISLNFVFIPDELIKNLNNLPVRTIWSSINYVKSKECITRKMENKELRKQFIKSHRTLSSINNSNTSECQRCQKMLTNSTYHYAHHKKRHPELSSMNPKGINEVQALRNEIAVLKYQLKKISSRKANESELNENGETKTGIPTLKMILTPESGCLEAQEKYWRGKVKEIQRLLDEVAAENSSLKEQLINLKNASASSVAVQTEFSYLALKNSIKDFLSDTDGKCTGSFNVDRSATSAKFFRSIPITSTFTNSSYMYSDENTDSTNLKSKLFMPQENYPSTSFSYNMCSSLPSSRLCSPLLNTSKSNFADDSKLFTTNSGVKHSYLIDNFKKKPLKNEFTTFSEKADVIEEVDSFLQNYDKSKSKCHNEDERMNSEKSLREKTDKGGDGNDVQQVITKLFTSDDSSELLADKLIKIYEKRRSLVTDEDDIPDADVVKPSSNIRLAEKEVKNLISNEVEDFSPAKDMSNKNSENRACIRQSASAASFNTVSVNECDETTVEENRPKNRREKLKFLPIFRNISSRIMKNYSKSRKTNASKIETKGICKVSGAHLKDRDDFSNDAEPQYDNEHPSHKCETTDLCLRNSNVSGDFNERKLISAMKKSKSTGNITKKVAFMDELPSFKTASESDLRKITDVEDRRNVIPSENKTATALSKLSKPVPAPRSKKNVASKNFQSNIKYGKQTSTLQEN